MSRLDSEWAKHLPHLNEDERNIYVQGYSAAYRDINHISAFAAIRRAAEVARWHDFQSTVCIDDDIKGNYEWCADQIRRAIRAAIGSDKA